MSGPAALEARVLGLVHRPACDGAGVEVETVLRPGVPGPPATFTATTRRGKVIEYQRGPALTGPSTKVRRARCLDCGSQVVR